MEPGWSCSGTLSAVAGPMSHVGAALGAGPVPAFSVPLFLLLSFLLPCLTAFLVEMASGHRVGRPMG